MIIAAGSWSGGAFPAVDKIDDHLARSATVNSPSPSGGEPGGGFVHQFGELAAKRATGDGGHTGG